MSAVTAPIDLPQRMMFLTPWVLLKCLITESRVFDYWGPKVMKSPVLEPQPRKSKRQTL